MLYSTIKTKQILTDGRKRNDSIDLEGICSDGSLVIVDSLASYFDLDHIDETNRTNKLNFL